MQRRARVCTRPRRKGLAVVRTRARDSLNWRCGRAACEGSPDGREFERGSTQCARYASHGPRSTFSSRATSSRRETLARTAAHLSLPRLRRARAGQRGGADRSRHAGNSADAPALAAGAASKLVPIALVTPAHARGEPGRGSAGIARSRSALDVAGQPAVCLTRCLGRRGNHASATCQL